MPNIFSCSLSILILPWLRPWSHTFTIPQPCLSIVTCRVGSWLLETHQLRRYDHCRTRLCSPWCNRNFSQVLTVETVPPSLAQSTGVIFSEERRASSRMMQPWEVDDSVVRRGRMLSWGEDATTARSGCPKRMHTMSLRGRPTYNHSRREMRA